MERHVDVRGRCHFSVVFLHPQGIKTHPTLVIKRGWLGNFVSRFLAGKINYKCEWPLSIATFDRAEGLSLGKNSLPKSFWDVAAIFSSTLRGSHLHTLVFYVFYLCMVKLRHIPSVYLSSLWQLLMGVNSEKRSGVLSFSDMFHV